MGAFIHLHVDVTVAWSSGSFSSHMSGMAPHNLSMWLPWAPPHYGSVGIIRFWVQCRRPRFNPWLGKIACRRQCLPLQYSCLVNSIDRGAWQVTVHEVTKNGTHLSKQQTTTVLFKSLERISVTSQQRSMQFSCSRFICRFVSLCFFVVPPGLPSHVPFSNCYLYGQWTQIGN